MNSSRRLVRRPSSLRSQSRRSRSRQQAFLRTGLRAEQLEPRTMMASDMVTSPFLSSFWNVQDPRDVNSDGNVSPADALIVIDQLNSFGSRPLISPLLASQGLQAGADSEGEQSTSPTGGMGFVDVNNDGYLSPVDALIVIDDLNAEGEPGDEVAYSYAAVVPGTNTPLPGNSIVVGQDFELVVRVQDLRGPSPNPTTLKRGVATGYLDVLLDNPSLISVHVNEVQQLALSGNGGTFQLSIDGVAGNFTSNITYDPFNQLQVATDIQAALQAKFAGGTAEADFTVSYDFNADRYNIRFQDRFGDQNLSNLTVTHALTGGGTASVSEVRPGDRNNPAAFREAFRSRPGVPAGNPAFYQDPVRAANQGNRWDEVGGSYIVQGQAATYPGAGLLELARVRINAENAGSITFDSDFTQILVSDVTTLYSRFINGNSQPIVPFSAVDEPDPLTITITELITANPDTITLVEDNGAPEGQAPTSFTFNPVSQPPVVPAAGIGQDVKNAGAAAGNLRITAVNGNTLAINAGAAITLASGSKVFFNPSTVAAQTTITYTPAANLNGPAAETFSYTVSDGVNSDTGTVTVNLTATNDRPINKIGGVNVNSTVIASTEGVNLAFTGANMLAVTDVDFIGSESMTVALSVTPGSGSLNLASTTGLTINSGANGSSTVTFTGTLLNVNAALNGLTYVPTADFAGSTTFTIESRDNGNSPSGQLISTAANSTITINVGAINDAPVNTVPGGTQNVVENRALVFSVANGNAISVSDVDAAGGPFDGGRLSVTVSSTLGRTLTAVVGGGAIITPASGIGSSLQIRGTKIQIDAALNGLSYAAGSFGSGANDTITIVTNDQGNSGISFDQGNNGVAPDPLTDTDTIAITIEPARRPQAVNDNFTRPEGPATFTMDVLKLGTGLAGEDLFTNGSSPFIVSAALIPGTSGQGSIAIVPGTDLVLGTTDDRIVYTPPHADYFGTVQFNYTVNETPVSPDGPSTALVTLVITPDNDLPVANADPGYATNEDALLNVSIATGVLANDTDPDNTQDQDGDGDPDPTQTLTAVLVSDVTSGNLTLNQNGSFTYQPDQDFFGTDSFTYRVQDGTGQSNVATVTITVNPLNDAPDTDPDSYTTAEDTDLVADGQSGRPNGVLFNDSDVENNPISVVPGVFQPRDAGNVIRGSVVMNANGTFTYDVPDNFTGTVTFQYQATDGTTPSAATTVTINVTAVNDAPVAVNDPGISVAEDGSVAISVLSNDTDVDFTALFVNDITVDPLHGEVTINANGTVTYTPDDNYFGPDSFEYTVRDAGFAVSASAALVTITVTPVNDNPVAVNDTPATGVVYTTTEDTDLNAAVSVLANDTDAEIGTALQTDLDVANVANTLIPRDSGGTQRGTIVMNFETGTFVYDPSPDFNGTVTFTYFVTDGTLNSLVAGTVQITVTGDNDAPVAGDDEYTAIKDLDNQVISVLGNDTDIDSSASSLFVSSVIGFGGAIGVNNGAAVATEHGTVKLEGGVIKYSPTDGYSGDDTFDYTVSDGDKTDVGTVAVDVIAFIPKAISGQVFVDADGDGVRFAGEAYVDGSNGRPANDVYDDGETFVDTAGGVRDNNRYDAPERFLEGVTVQLTGTQKLTANDPGVAINLPPATTDAQGRYEFLGDASTQFLGLAPGDYFVTEVQPAFVGSLDAVNNVEIASDAELASKVSVNSFQVVWTAEQSIVTGHLHGLDFTETGFDFTQTGSGGEDEVMWMQCMPGFDGMTSLSVDVNPSNLDSLLITINGVQKRIYQSLYSAQNQANNVGGMTPPVGSRARFRVLREADGTIDFSGENNASTGRNGIIFALGSGIIIRLDGTAADFGFDLSANFGEGGEGEGELPVNREYADSADEVFAGEAWA